MKKILYIFLTLSIISVGCSKEDEEIQVTQETPSSLDNKLYGVWKDVNDSYDNSFTYEYYRSFSSNGKWSSWTIRIIPSDQSYHSTINENSGSWWTQDNKLFTDYHNSTFTDVWTYNVNGNTLTIDGISWNKQ